MKRLFPFFLFLIAVNTWSETHPNQKAKQSNTATTIEQRGTDEKPFTVKIQKAPDADEKAAKDEEYRKDKAKEDRTLTTATIVLAAVTFILAICTAGLWIVTYRLAKDAEKTSRRQAREMKDSIAIAKASVDLAQQEFIATKRAYVFVDHIDARIMPVGEHNLRIQVTWRNSGATPTKNMRNHININFFENDIPDDYIFPDFGSENIPLFIGPNGIALSDPLIIKKEDLDKINSKIVRAYIYGWAEYFDIVDSLKIHRTEFCHRLLMEASEITDTGKTRAAISFRLHRTHNGMDDECEKQLFTKLS
jgi:hypothetical protein